jgi:predicted nucleic acid-binding protein
MFIQCRPPPRSRQQDFQEKALPDFFIGAHAAVEDLTLLTRDPRRFRAYFPRLRFIAQ